MRRIHHATVAAATAVVIVCGMSAVNARQDAPPKIKTKEYQPVPSVQGRYNFVAYCAACHGSDGKGQGPAAPALKMPVPDLTTIARRHGKFDSIGLERLISGQDKMPASHGSVEMPMWGQIFKSSGGDGQAMLRLRNLVKYLQSIQAPAT